MFNDTDHCAACLRLRQLRFLLTLALWSSACWFAAFWQNDQVGVALVIFQTIQSRRRRTRPTAE